MKKKYSQKIAKLNRRQLIKATAGIGALTLSSKTLLSKESNPQNLPPNVPEWTDGLGDGVDVNPYGFPSEFEDHVVRRNVEWLTASTESSVNFTPIQDLEGIITPNGLCFERHHGGTTIINPTNIICVKLIPLEFDSSLLSFVIF